MECDVLIIGGGPAGLSQALWQMRSTPDAVVRVLEAGPRPGGWVRSESRDGYLCEHGPQAIRSTPEFLEFVEELALSDAMVAASPAAATRWLGRDGRLIAVPTKPLGMIGTSLLSPFAKLRLLRESRQPVRPPGSGTESVAAFCERRFGPKTVPLVQAMLGGIYAGDASRIELSSAMPVLAELEQEHGSVFRGMRARRQARRDRGEPARPAQQVYSFVGGIEGMVRRLADRLGDSLEVGVPVASVAHDGLAWTARLEDGTTRRARKLVLACPARISARLLAEHAPGLAAELAAIPYASLASVYLGVPMAKVPAKLSGFGFLLEHQPDQPVLGAIYVSQLFPHHAPQGHQLLRVMIGGSLHPDAWSREEHGLVEMAKSTVAQHLGCPISPSFTHVVRCREAIPQYELGHEQRMNQITRMLQEQPDLRLCGNSYTGIAVTAQLARGAGLGGGGTGPAESAASGSGASESGASESGASEVATR